MSGIHAHAERPTTRDRAGRPILDTNDEQALNGGSTAFLYRGREERRPPRWVKGKTIGAFLIFGALLICAALLAAAV